MTYKELINSDQPVLVDFFAEWCGPCKAMAPILKDVVRQLDGAGRVIKVDIDKNPGLAQQLRIQGVPTFMVYRNGKQLWRQSGMQSAQALLQVMRSAATEEV